MAFQEAKLMAHLPQAHLVQAGVAHLDQLVPMFDAYRVFYQQASDPVAARAYLEERLRQAESAIFMAQDPVTAAAWGFAQLYPSFSSISLGRVWILYDLYVIPEKRRKGVGKALMEAAHEFARESGAHTVSLATAKDNVAGQQLYESLGYVRDQEFYYYDLRF
jgi:ribosomal protein S18 acetylase RimI-like enzyme